MAFKDLRGFIRRLEDVGELARVAAPVDPVLEIAEITDRISKSPSGGKALFFENVRGSDFPVVTNIFGSPRRICLALGVDEPDDLARLMEGLLARLPAGPNVDGINEMSFIPEFSRFAPREVADGHCREVVESRTDLERFPVLKNFAGDGGPDRDGRFITLPLVITRDPDTGSQNCGIYRVEVIGKDRLCIHWRDTSGGAGHWRKYLERGERMPVAVALGGDPATIFAAASPIPESVDEMTFAGFLRGEAVTLLGSLTNDLKVPAEAEMVAEGFIEPGETCLGGAFGNHTGFYDPPRTVPVMRIECITRRRDVIYPATVVGRPPMEDCWLAKAWERILLPMIRLELPAVIDINMPLEGIFHGCAIVAVEKEGADTPRRVMEAVWRGRLLGNARLLVVVDAGTDVRDLSLVAWKVINLVDWGKDMTVENSLPSPRIGLDATIKSRFHRGEGACPEEITRGASLMEMVDKRWREFGF